FLSRAVGDGGVEEVLVVGGDGFEPLGPFEDAAALIRSGILGEAGIRKVGVGGYPDGHPDVGDGQLRSDLETKWSLTQQQKLELRIITQFSFAPDRIADYCEKVADWVPGVPVYAGLAGPTSPAQLIRFAKICGVSMSLRGANKLGLNAFKLAANAGPEKQMKVLARRCAERTAGNLVAIHLFSFGGFIESSTWLESRLQASGLS
ncbi:MAG: methylenetetrahydrofolate reductase, partial [Gammaproteobacteria bacterium]|nr:methylenetetrahydrofolate reductase [Gammaproteobacteria bacterium]